jgi:hypothetical protein
MEKEVEAEMKTIPFISHLRGLFYCPLCRKVYYQLEECDCPFPEPIPVQEEKNEPERTQD